MALPVTFTGTSGQDITTIGFAKRSPDTGQLLLTTDGRCRPGSTAASVQYTWPTDEPSNANYWVESDFIFLDRAKTQRTGVIGRASATDRTFYLVRIQYVSFGATAALQLWKAVAGTFTQLGSSYNFAVTDGTNGQIRLDMNGTTIRALLNGVERISVTDSSISSAGRIGLYNTFDDAGSDTGGMQLDNLNASFAGSTPIDIAADLVSTTTAQASLSTGINLLSGMSATTAMAATLLVSGASLEVDAQARASMSATLDTGVALTCAMSASTAMTATIPSTQTAIIYDFPGGNINGSLSSVADEFTDNPTVTVRVRSPDDAEWQQAEFGVSGVRNKNLDFEVLLIEKEDDPDQFRNDWQGPWWTTDRTAGPAGWTNVSSWSQVSGDRMSFSISPGAVDEIYVSTVPPWNTEVVLAWINELATSYPTRIHDDLPSRIAAAIGPYICALSGIGTDENGRSINNLPLYGFRIGDDTLGAQPKRRIVLFCGVHSGEWNGGLQLRGFINELLTGAYANDLLSRFDFYVYPLHSVKGNYLGFRRNEAAATYFNNADANREWADGDTTIATVVQWQAIMDADHGVDHKQLVKGFYDFHDGKFTSSTAWFYYRPSQPNAAAYAALVAAENGAITSQSSSTAGTTTSYWFDDKQILFSFTCEMADEKSTVAQAMAYGAAYARSLKTADDAGYVPQFQNLFTNVRATSSLQATLDTGFALSTAIGSTATMAATLDTGVELSAGLSATSSMSAELGSVPEELYSSFVSEARMTAQLTTAIPLQVAMSASVSGEADLTTAGPPGQCPSADDIATAVWAKVIESGVTAEQMMRVFTAVLAGEVAGAGSGTERFKSQDGTKDRVVSTVDQNGNRTSVVVDGT